MRRKRAARILQRKPRSWLGVMGIVFSLAAVAFANYETDSEGKLSDGGEIFANFADLNLGADAVVRMRNSPLPPTKAPHRVRWRTITAVLDGDTVRLDGNETVRLIGVDAPESNSNRKLREDMHKMGGMVRERNFLRLGELSTEFVRRLALGRRCWLEYEQSPKDQYGRTLAYVHLGDGRILNEELLSQGYGKVYLNAPSRYRKRYVMLQTTAEVEKRGLWRGAR